MIIKYNKKIFTSNFIKKKINYNIKNFRNLINTRFAPEAGGFLHIGHIKSILLNIEISKIYNGLCIIRIDDTNPINNRLKYKNLIKSDINYFNFFKKNLKKKFFYTSNYFNKLYQYIEFLIKKIFKFKLIILKLKKIRNMRKGKFKEKTKIFKFKLKNIFIKVYRILYKKHYRTNYFWFIYPLYDYSNILSDKIENTKYSLCTLEFLENKKIFNLLKINIYKKLLPIQLEFSKLIFKKNLTSKRLILNLIKKKYIKNNKDRRLLTISSFKSLKINKNYLISFCKRTSISKNNIKINKKNIFKNINIKKIEFFFIKDPINLIIKNFKKNKIEKIFIKNNFIYFSKFLIIDKNIINNNKKHKIKIKKKKKYHLKYTKYNITFLKILKNKSKTFLICNIYNIKKKKYKPIIWINKFYKKKFILNINENLLKYNYLKKNIKWNFNFKSTKKCIIQNFLNFNIKNWLKIKKIKNNKLEWFLIKKSKNKFIRNKFYKII